MVISVRQEYLLWITHFEWNPIKPKELPKGTSVLREANLQPHTMPPSQSYRIWFTQRSGSTMLCEALKATGLAGQPEELFNITEGTGLLHMHGATDYEELCATLWRKGTGANGIFGIKHSYFASRHDHIIQELCQLRGISFSPAIDTEAFWNELFPNVCHIYLMRRNKIRQAVSWWKAIQDNQWHIWPGQQGISHEADFYDQRYDFAALTHLYKEVALRDCAIEAYFQRNQITPLTIVYEDMDRDLQATLERILRYLDLPTAGIIAQRPLQRTATAASEVWVERFRNDLQQEMGVQVW